MKLVQKESHPFPRYIINVRVLFILHIEILIIFIYLRLNILLGMRLVLYHARDTTSSMNSSDYRNSFGLGAYSKLEQLPDH